MFTDPKPSLWLAARQACLVAFVAVAVLLLDRAQASATPIQSIPGLLQVGVRSLVGGDSGLDRAALAAQPNALLRIPAPRGDAFGGLSDATGDLGRGDEYFVLQLQPLSPGERIFLDCVYLFYDSTHAVRQEYAVSLTTANVVFAPGFGPEHLARILGPCDGSSLEIYSGTLVVGFASSMPNVRIETLIASLTERGGPQAAFRVTRSGELTSPLTVSYRVGGTAAPGIDLETLPGAVTIPIGASSADIQVVPIPDTIREGAETVEVELTQAPAYLLDTAPAASIALLNIPTPPFSPVAVRCQARLDEALGNLVTSVRRAHARCLNTEAAGRTCDVVQRNGAIARAIDHAGDVLDGACSDVSYAELGLATTLMPEAIRDELVANALALAISLVRGSYGGGYVNRP